MGLDPGAVESRTIPDALFYSLLIFLLLLTLSKRLFKSLSLVSVVLEILSKGLWAPYLDQKGNKSCQFQESVSRGSGG